MNNRTAVQARLGAIGALAPRPHLLASNRGTYRTPWVRLMDSQRLVLRSDDPGKEYPAFPDGPTRRGLRLLSHVVHVACTAVGALVLGVATLVLLGPHVAWLISHAGGWITAGGH